MDIEHYPGVVNSQMDYALKNNRLGEEVNDPEHVEGENIITTLEVSSLVDTFKSVASTTTEVDVLSAEVERFCRENQQEFTNPSDAPNVANLLIAQLKKSAIQDNSPEQYAKAIQAINQFLEENPQSKQRLEDAAISADKIEVRMGAWKLPFRERKEIHWSQAQASSKTFVDVCAQAASGASKEVKKQIVELLLEGVTLVDQSGNESMSKGEKTFEVNLSELLQQIGS